jgi:antitoxin (DNA-binding transcriptional repressor) of toxin-antitoxin stability system
MLARNSELIDCSRGIVYHFVYTIGVQMEFIGVRELRSKSAQVWGTLARTRELVVTSNGKPIAIITPTSAATLERSLRDLRQARAISAVAEMHKSARKRGLHALSMDEIGAEIRASRKARRR